MEKRALCSSKWRVNSLKVSKPCLYGALVDRRLVPLVVLALHPELVLAPDL